MTRQFAKVGFQWLLFGLFTASFVSATQADDDRPWPQYGGPNRDNISPDTGLMSSWPEGGPRLLWTAYNLGEGYSSVSLADGKILTMGGIGDSEFVICLNESDGSEIWRIRNGSNRDDGMGGGPRGTPTIVEDRFYALGANGDMGCYDLESGDLHWGGNILQRFNAGNISWGISESILVDGDNVVFTPGGNQNTMVCVDRVTGEIRWNAEVPGNPAAGYSSAIVAEVGGVRQYVNFTHTAVVAVRADNGEFLWSNTASANGTANCSSPLFHDNMVFSASGYGTGGACVRLSASGRGVSAEQLYHTSDMKSHHGGMVEIDGYVYGTDDGVLKCLNMATGEVMWQDRSVGKGAVVYADGKIFLRSEDDGEIAMFEATPEAYRELGRFNQPQRSERPAWPHPVIANGRLYLRDWDKLLCFDLRGDGG